MPVLCRKDRSLPTHHTHTPTHTCYTPCWGRTFAHGFTHTVTACTHAPARLHTADRTVHTAHTRYRTRTAWLHSCLPHGPITFTTTHTVCTRTYSHIHCWILLHTTRTHARRTAHHGWLRCTARLSGRALYHATPLVRAPAVPACRAPGSCITAARCVPRAPACHYARNVHTTLLPRHARCYAVLTCRTYWFALCAFRAFVRAWVCLHTGSATGSSAARTTTHLVRHCARLHTAAHTPVLPVPRTLHYAFARLFWFALPPAAHRFCLTCRTLHAAPYARSRHALPNAVMPPPYRRKRSSCSCINAQQRVAHAGTTAY